MSIRTEGFAAMNAARPPEHLLKELVQNALDSLDPDGGGRVCLSDGLQGELLLVHCADNGIGIDNLAELRVVYRTHKTDSHRKRGRFGRGFKEALCIAEQARGASGKQPLALLQESGVTTAARSAPMPVRRSGSARVPTTDRTTPNKTGLQRASDCVTLTHLRTREGPLQRPPDSRPCKGSGGLDRRCCESR